MANVDAHDVPASSCAPSFSIPHLSFATELLFNLDDVRVHCSHGLAVQNHVVTLLKARIQVERTYALELRKMAENAAPLGDAMLLNGTLHEALSKLQAQYLNTSVQHRLLADNLEEDVVQPIEALLEHQQVKAQNLGKLVGNIKKQAKVQEDAYKKEYAAFDREFRDATTSFDQAMDAGFSSTLLEQQYLRNMEELAWEPNEDEDDDEQGKASRRASARQSQGVGSPQKKQVVSPKHRLRHRHSSSSGSGNNNSQKLVQWLLSSEQQRKDSLFAHAVEALEDAELARRECQQTWDLVEQSRIDLFSTLQSVLTEYQQMAEHRSANLATNLRKHVVFESSALANEQYDWQMLAPAIEHVDFEGDLREFILSTHHTAHDLSSMTIHDLCTLAVVSALVTSPTARPSRELRKTPLVVSDLAHHKIPIDFEGNREMLASVLVTRAPSSATTAMRGISATLDSSATSVCRVSLAQDVARAIARAYEWRSMQRNLQEPLYAVDQADPDQTSASSAYTSSASQSNDIDDDDAVPRNVVSAVLAPEILHVEEHHNNSKSGLHMAIPAPPPEIADLSISAVENPY